MIADLKVLLLTALISCLPFGCSDSSTEEDLIPGLDVSSLKAQVSSNKRSNLNDQISSSRQTAITVAVKKVSAAVCGINVTQFQEARRGNYYRDPFFQFFFPEMIPRQAVKSLGSGFLISSDGYLLTNEHVIHNASEIVVSLSDGKTADAKLVGSDYVTDMALIKIEGKNYPYLEFGDSDNVLIGEWAIAIGNPFGLFEINSNPTVTVGVVSAVDRDFGRQRNERVYEDMIQTDAAINQGNSGGPLINSIGQVIGLNTFIYTGDGGKGSIGLGFAIPSNRMLRVLQDLKKFGEVNRSWTTGLTVEDIPPMVARYFKMKSAEGVIITNVEKGSPAAEASLEIGDIIIEINEKKIRKEDDIWKVIDDSDLRGGDALKLKIIRDRKAYSVSLRLRELRNNTGKTP